MSENIENKGRDEKGRFAEGNTISVGNDGGRPSMYDTAEELEKKILDYFEWIKGEYEEREGERKIITKDGSVIEEKYAYWFELRKKEIPTITGLAIFLGFASRQSMYDYIIKPEFAYEIKRALLKVENSYENRLWDDKPTGAIFALKNMGWADKIINETTGKDGKPMEHEITTKVIFEDYTKQKESKS